MKTKSALWALCLSASILLPSAAPAEEGANTPGKGPRPERREKAKAAREKIARKLELSKEQREQLRPIMKAHAEAARAIRQNESIDNAEKRQQIRTLREQHLAKLSTILTPDQLETFKKLRKHGKPGNKGSGAPPAA